MMRRDRGFTLIELVVVLAIIVIMAALVVVGMRSSARNNELSGAASDIAARVFALRSAALSEGEDRILVFVDAPGSDASGCWAFATATCSRLFVLRNPSTTWELGDFDPATPEGTGTSTATVVDVKTFSTGIHLDRAAVPIARPEPFTTSVAVHDTDLTTDCGGRACFGFRFTATGDVLPAYPVTPAAGTPTKVGYAFVLGTDRNVESRGAERREMLVAFPGGIVRSFAF